MTTLFLAIVMASLGPLVALFFLETAPGDIDETKTPEARPETVFW